MKRWFSFSLALLLVAGVLAGCAGSHTENASSSSSQENASYTVNLATLAGPTGMGMAYMLDRDDTANTYRYTVASSPDEITGKLLSGSYDMAALPTNVAATLYNGSNGKIQLLALNTLCVLYVLEHGDSIRSMEDLRGKTVYISGQGSTPEYLFKELLTENGLEPDVDVMLDYTYATHSDLAAYAASGQADVVLLPEPMVTSVLSKNSELRVALDLNDVWEATEHSGKEGSIISMGCVVVRTEFAEKNPQAVSNFLADYRLSVEKVTDAPDEVAKKTEKLGIVAKAALAKAALPRCQIVFVAGDKMKSQIEPFYRVLMAYNPKSIGGQLPDDAFYYHD